MKILKTAHWQGMPIVAISIESDDGGSAPIREELGYPLNTSVCVMCCLKGKYVCDDYDCHEPGELIWVTETDYVAALLRC